MKQIGTPALSNPDKTLNYGQFSIELATRTLFARSKRIDVGPKVVETLLVLVRTRGRFISKEALMEAVWPDGGGSDETIWRNISTLRKVLRPLCGDVITTLSRRGYRLEPLPAFELRRPRATLGRFAAAFAACVAVGWPSFVSYPAAERSGLSAFTGTDRELYVIARYELDHRTDATLVQAVTNFRVLVARHPTSGIALAGLAEALLLRGDYLNADHPSNPYTSQARLLAVRAVTACPGCAETHAALGVVEAYRNPALDAGVSELTSSIGLDPDSASAHLWLGEALLNRGEDRAALRQLERAESIDPASPAIDAWLGYGYYLTDDSARAVQYSRRAIELDQRRYDAAITLAYAYEEHGRLTQALRIYRGLGGSRIDPAWRDVLMARVYAESGNRSRALALLQVAPHPHDAVDVATETAGLLGLLGNHKAAIDILRQAVQREGFVEHFTSDPRLSFLRDDRELVRLDTAQMHAPVSL